MTLIINGKPVEISPDYAFKNGIVRSGANVILEHPVKPISREAYNELSEDEKMSNTLFIIDEAPWMSLTESVQDYDIEDGWHVRKWTSGFAECFKIFEHTTAISTASPISGAYAAATNFTLTAPDIFTQLYCKSVTLQIPDTDRRRVWLTPISNTEYGLMSAGGSLASATYSISCHLTGKWE